MGAMMDLSTSGRRRVRRPVLPGNYRNCSLHAEIEPDVDVDVRSKLKNSISPNFAGSPIHSSLPLYSPYQIFNEFLSILPYGKRKKT